MKAALFCFTLAVAAACTRVSSPASAHPQQIVVLGDSVAHGAGDTTGRGIAGNLRPAANNLGINGARTATVLALLRSTGVQQQIASARAVVVSIGGNDLYGSRAAQLMTTICPACGIRMVLPRVAAVVRRIHALNPHAHVVLLGLYNPYRDRKFLDRQVNLWDAQLIARFAKESRVDVIRIADLFRAGRLSQLDHFHPSAAGYALIAARIAPSL